MEQKKPTFLMMKVMMLVSLLTGAFLLGPMIAGKITYAVESAKVDAARENLAQMSQYDGLSTLFRAVSKAVKPGVVELRVSKKVSVRGGGLEDFFSDTPFDFGPFRRQIPRRPREYVQRGLGSGVIVDAEKGYVLTNHHVVGGADAVDVVLSDGRKFKAEWIRSDPKTDLAVVKIKGEKLTDVPIGDSSQVEVGDWVLAIGSPEGLDQTVTAGIISAKGRQTSGDSDKYQNFLQTDAAINRGNSGGPLVNMKGEIIGINTAIVSRTGGNEGIGFAIPSNMAKNIMTQLVEHGKVTRGWLGVEIMQADEDLAKNLNIPEGTKGVVVSMVVKDSPADKGGIKLEDFIVSINDKEVADPNQLRNRIAEIKPGTEIAVGVIREGKAEQLKIKVANQPDDINSVYGLSEGEPSEIGDFGLEVTTLTSELARQAGVDERLKGVLITGVDSNSHAAQMGITPGMVITHVQGVRVINVKGFRDTLTPKNIKGGVRIQLVDRSGTVRLRFIRPMEKAEED